MSKDIITFNAGSNSLKCGVYEAEMLSPRFRVEIERIHNEASITIEDAAGETVLEQPIDSGYASALNKVLSWYDRLNGAELVAAGHRVVHGGKDYDAPVELTDAVRQKLEALVPLAPLHQPHNIKLMKILAEQKPGIRQVACFDTAFHRTQPWLAEQFALPRGLVEKEHIYRYGFHGLSYEYIAEILPEHIHNLQGQRVVVAHMGSGASMCALEDGKSVATTMGFTALDGLMMATRCGDLDPGVVLYLLQQKGMNVQEVESLLYKESGLLGVSGISADMRDLDTKEEEHAKQAVDLFCYMAAKQLGGLIMVLGGLDALVFTGAMGVNDLLVRAKICDYVKWIGVELDEMANAQPKTRITTAESAIPVLVLPTDEEYMIAKHTASVLSLA